MNWFERVPKVELHLHLEGAIPHATLWELIQKYGGRTPGRTSVHGDPSVPSLEALKQRFQYRDFAHFIRMWIWKNGFLRETEDFTRIAEAVAKDLARQNIRYAEVFYSPTDFARHGLDVQEITHAIRDGLSKVPEIEVMLVADLVRDGGPERAARTLAQVNEVREQGVIGIGIGGSEHDHPPEPFAGVYKRARHLGFRTSAHAGEAAGTDSVWGAIRALRVDRIGHGTRAREDEALLNYMAAHEIPIEMCPLSNVRTAVVGSLAEHPIRDYYQRGIVVTVNTDDPKMFGNSLAQEYSLLETELGFTRDDVRTLILNGIRVSWLPEDKKEALTDAFCGDPAWTQA